MPLTIRAAQTVAAIQAVVGAIVVLVGVATLVAVAGSLGGEMSLGLLLLGIAVLAVPLALLVAAISLGALERWAQVALYIIEFLVVAASCVVLILSTALGVLSIVVAVFVLLFLTTPSALHAVSHRDSGPPPTAASPWARSAGDRTGAGDDDGGMWDPGPVTPEPSLQDMLGYWRKSLRKGRLG